MALGALHRSMRRVVEVASSRAELAAPLTFGVGTFLLLSVFKRWATIHLDTARDMLIARDCTWGARCWGIGASSSFPDVVHGAAWIHALQIRDGLSVSITSFQRIIDVLLAGAAGLVAWIDRAVFERPSGLWAWALWFPLALAVASYPVLWNPTLLPIAAVVLQALLFQGVRTSRGHWFIAAGLACALVVDLHWANIFELPFLLFAVIACAATPWLIGPASVLALVALLAIDSPAALEHNSQVASSYAVLPMSAAAVFAGSMLRGFFLSRPAVERARLLAMVQVGYVGLSMVAVGAVTGHPLHSRYFALAVAPAAWLLGRGKRSSAPRGRSAAMAALLVTVGYIAVWAADRAWNQDLRLDQVEPIAMSLYGRGLSFADIRRHLRGPKAFEVIAALAPFEPRLSEFSRGSAGADILQFRTKQKALPRPLPEGWTTVSLGGEDVAVLASYEPFVQTDDFEFCRESSGPSECMHLSFEEDELERRRDDGWRARAYPAFRALQQRFPTQEIAGSRVRFRLHTRPPPGASARYVFALQGSGEVAWRIDDAPGVRDAPFPAVEVQLSGQEAGEMVFSGVVPMDSPYTFRAWLPAFVELPVGPAAEAFRDAARPSALAR